jgi:hypothetical protein
MLKTIFTAMALAIGVVAFGGIIAVGVVTVAVAVV